MKYKISLVNLGISCFILSQSTYAGLFDSDHDIDVTVQGKVMADLGPETRQLFNTLPENIKDNFVKGIQESMPIIDKSVMKYMDRIDLSIKNSMENSHDPIICTSNGVSKNLLETLKDSLFGSRPIPIAKVYNDYNQLGLLKLDKDPLFYKVKYADFLGNATRVECQFLNGRTEKLQVIEFRQRVDYRWKVWDDLDGKCLKSYKCYEFAKKQLEIYIKDSDPRDLKKGDFDAIKNFNQLPDPKVYIPNKNKTLKFIEIESSIINTVRIYDAISLIKLYRVKNETNNDNNALSKIDESDKEFIKNVDFINNAFNQKSTTIASLTSVLSILKDYINKNKQLSNNLIDIKNLITNEDTLQKYNKLQEKIEINTVDLNSKLNKVEEEIKKIPSSPPTTTNPEPDPSTDPCSRPSSGRCKASR